jgi:hypothetical protein
MSIYIYIEAMGIRLFWNAAGCRNIRQGGKSMRRANRVPRLDPPYVAYIASSLGIRRSHRGARWTQKQPGGRPSQDTQTKPDLNAGPGSGSCGGLLAHPGSSLLAPLLASLLAPLSWILMVPPDFSLAPPGSPLLLLTPPWLLLDPHCS